MSSLIVKCLFLADISVFQGGGSKKKYDEDEDFEDTGDSDETDSDFEDPDTIEVPKTLSAGADKKAQTTTIEDGSDDDIEVISSTNGTKFGGGFPMKGGGILGKWSLEKHGDRHIHGDLPRGPESSED